MKARSLSDGATMPIYTKEGDKGETMVLGGMRRPKDDDRIEAYGQIDELNAILGIVISFSEVQEVNDILKDIQKDLFIIGAELATVTGQKRVVLSLQRVEKVEKTIDKIDSTLPVLKHFILPGGSKTAALLHLARAVCRRAERRVVTLLRNEKINEAIVIYLNRLSDLLFVLARYVNRKKRVPEMLWRG